MAIAAPVARGPRRKRATEGAGPRPEAPSPPPRLLPATGFPGPARATPSFLAGSRQAEHKQLQPPRLARRRLRHASEGRQEEEGRGQVGQEGQGPRQQVRWQSQEEEVVQREGEGQAEQPGPLRQGHV